MKKDTRDWGGIVGRGRYIDVRLRRERKAWARATAKTSEAVLKEIDFELWQRIQEQYELYKEAFKISAVEMEVQTAAMCRGWDAMKQRIDQAIASGEIDWKTGMPVRR